MERIYLDKLDKNYFKECIQEAIDYYMEDNKEEALDRLELLDIQVTGLRDTFGLFAIDDIIELKKPIKKCIEELSACKRENK